MSTSSNMSLPIPNVGSTAGPDFAYDLNSCLTLIDQHDHTPGKGAQITPASLNINATLDIGSNQITNALSLSITASASASTVVQALSVAPGTESPTPIQDLWYTDSNGTAIQLTSNGLVNATIASLAGQSYSSGTFFWKQGAGSTTPANFDIGAVVLRPRVAATSYGVTLTPPGGIASAWTMTLPADPASAGGSNFLVMDTSGNVTGSALVDNSSIQFASHQLSVKAGGITAAMLANSTLSQETLYAASQSITVPANVNFLSVMVVGGGGGGGGGQRSPTQGGGGGGGAMPITALLPVTPGETLALVVGAAGAGGAATLSGSAGGVSKITRSGTILVQSTGGTAGTSSTGAVSSFPFVIGGGNGGLSGVGSAGSSSPQGTGGAGAGSGGSGGGGGGGAGYGDGGAGGAGNVNSPGGAAGSAGVGRGAGGGGGGGGSANSGAAGGAGGAGTVGCIIIAWVAL